MKKSIKYVLALVLCLCFVLVGCTPKLEMPKGNIDSNGGSVVMVGDYVYYANTFVDYSSLSGNANEDKTTNQNALYRVKTDEFGYTTRDDDDFIENIEKVTTKISGFNNSNMFVVGNYLYFTSPNAHKNKKGEDLFKLTTLFRVKLDGTGRQEILSTETTQGKFFLVTEETPYLLVFDNSKISKLTIGDKLGKIETLVSDVLDVVFPTNYGKLDAFYYTTDISEQDKTAGLSGNYLHKFDLTNNNQSLISRNERETISLVAFEDGKLYYKRLDAETKDSLYYSNTMQETFENGEKVLTAVGETTSKDSTTDVISKFSIINEDNYVFEYNKKIMLNTETTPLVNEEAKIEKIYGDYVYYSTSKGLFRISYKDKKVQTVAEISNIKQGEGAVDIAGEYVYFYAKTANNSTDTYYCHRANNKIIEDGRTKVECIAEVLDEDIKENK